MSLCVACGSAREEDRPHCPVCGAGESQAAALADWVDDASPAGTPQAADDASGGTAGASGQPAAEGANPDDTLDTVDTVDTVGAVADAAHDDGDGGRGAVDGAERRPRRWPGFILVAMGLALIGGGAYTSYRNTHGHKLEVPALRPSHAPSRSATPSPTGVAVPSAPVVSGSVVPTDVTVEVAPALVGQPDVADIVQTLSTYFTAVNTRDFETYRSVLVATDERVGSEADFRQRFRTTTDSDVRLVGVQREAGGEILATVTFRSTQDPADAPDGVSSCLSWMLTYPMTRVDGALKIDIIRNFAETHRAC